MANFIDRRLNGKNKSTVNRQRFIRRYKGQIKRSVTDAIGKRSVTDIESGEDISIPSRDINEPFFHHGQGGRRDRVHPGNDQFVQGDQVRRPQGGQGQGSGEGNASDDGEGQDDFVFSISKDEYLDLLFEDLELPNLKNTVLDKIVEYKTARAGFCAEGIPSNIDIVRSLKGSLARRIAMTGDKRRRVREIEQQLTALEQHKEADVARMHQLRTEIEELKARIKKVPFIDTFDLRYRNYEKRPVPTSKAATKAKFQLDDPFSTTLKKVGTKLEHEHLPNYYQLRQIFDPSPLVMAPNGA